MMPKPRPVWEFTPENVLQYIASPMMDFDFNRSEVRNFVGWLLWARDPSGDRKTVAESMLMLTRDEVESLMAQYTLEKGVTV